VQTRVFSEGDYWVVEVYDENGQMLIRVGFDHEPSQDEVETLMQQVLAPPMEVTDSGDFNFGWVRILE
jgi:hypothetical protein